VAVSRAEIAAPEGVAVERLLLERGRWHFALRAETVPDRMDLTATAWVVGHELRASFVLLGPGEAQGYPCNVNVPKCPNCGAREDACVCE
jgi:hypothetical protein